jgi:hypothetical protein
MGVGEERPGEMAGFKGRVKGAQNHGEVIAQRVG